jgi:hypothetical protein
MCIAAHIFYFAYGTGLMQDWDLQKLGLFQDLLAMVSGNLLGGVIASLSDRKKENDEKERLLPTSPLSSGLKAARIAKTALIVGAPLVCPLLIAIPVQANSLLKYGSILGVGILMGAHLLTTRREFVHLQSPTHNIELEESIAPILYSRVDKVKKWFSKYGFLSACLVGLATYVIFGIATAETSTIQAGYATFLASTFLGAGITNLIQNRFVPGNNGRWVNELAYFLLYSTANLIIFYQYLTMVKDIYGKNLMSDTIPLFVLSLIIETLWGINFGNNLATIGQKKASTSPAVTNRMGIEELIKTYLRT